MRKSDGEERDVELTMLKRVYIQRPKARRNYSWFGKVKNKIPPSGS